MLHDKLRSEPCLVTQRDHPPHNYIFGRRMIRCPGKGVGSNSTTSSPDRGDVPKGQPEMTTFEKDNATRYSFDFTDLELDITKSAALGKYGGASTDVNIELRATEPSTRAVSLKLTGTQFDWLLRVISPATADLTLVGHCLNCYNAAIANKDGTWVHVGVSCGPGEGQFVLGDAPQGKPESESKPAAGFVPQAVLDDVKGTLRELLGKVKPYRMFLPTEVQKAYDKADVWAQATDDATAPRG